MRTYKALLREDRLEWLGEAPESQADAPLTVRVSIIEPEPISEEHTRGLAMAALMEKLAARGSFAEISNPIQWQRDLRQDRALPGRER